MGPPRLMDSQGLAQQVEVVVGGALAMIQIPRGPQNGSMCLTSPSASETPTYGRCLGYVDWNILCSSQGAMK